MHEPILQNNVRTQVNQVLKDEGLTLKCGACRRAYPIREGIPILLVDEAVIEAS